MLLTKRLEDGRVGIDEGGKNRDGHCASWDDQGGRTARQGKRLDWIIMYCQGE